MKFEQEMLPIIAHLAHLEGQVEKEECTRVYRIQRNQLRSLADPFVAPDRIFKQNFRVSKAMAHTLIERLAHHFPATRMSSLTPTHRVSFLAFLRPILTHY